MVVLWRALVILPALHGKSDALTYAHDHNGHSRTSGRGSLAVQFSRIEVNIMAYKVVGGSRRNSDIACQTYSLIHAPLQLPRHRKSCPQAPT
ncbi:hypothetical protein L227DRAFT_133746 [Lentinus tigrinus ALCF2SS1-6]|uniref:Secreted protein n=1 Tax=Lentinus tigrinus ALCF2SS1-6 TaxID=1328759 RepID=A0A5C2SQQ6_9APHY|nr:hypothetical protein L227DRAFT_133746 [Lentinus tigrinus ALCF2SS1-6]